MSEDECGQTPESCIPTSPLSDDERGKVAKLQRIFQVSYVMECIHANWVSFIQRL